LNAGVKIRSRGFVGVMSSTLPNIEAKLSNLLCTVLVRSVAVRPLIAYSLFQQPQDSNHHIHLLDAQLKCVTALGQDFDITG
jgi:hypothetical protein